MLAGIDYTGKIKTKYTCDRCETGITTDTRTAIYVQEPKGRAKKMWDLCPSCSVALERGIKKGKKRV
jgi:hypothetical protein